MADAEPFPILDRLRRGRFIITAEQANPAQMKRYNSLTRRGVIDAVTLPDLPLVAQFRDIRSALSGSAPSTDPLDSIEGTRQPIATISSALRTQGTVYKRITTAVERGAKALLALSGGGLTRRALGPFGRVTLPMNSFRTLELIQRLRNSGDIPPDIPAWAVENPLIQSVDRRVDRLARKIDAGADAILTQPPLLWDRFESWWNEADRRGLTRTPILVGIPVPRTIESLRMWFFLVGVGTGGREGRQVLDSFREASRPDAQDFDSFCLDWTANLIEKVLGLNDVAGIHLMPIVGSGGLEDLLSKAKLSPHQRARTDLDEAIAALGNDGIGVVHEAGLIDDPQIRGFLHHLDAFADARRSAAPNSSFSTYWNRITYRQHFRRPLARRPFTSTDEWELAVDLRQWDTPQALREAIERTLPGYVGGGSESEGGVLIGDFVPYSDSIVWQFNASFWNLVIDFVGAHGRDYRDAIQGSPDANLEFIRHNACRFYDQIRSIRETDPERICYVEIGVASIDYARAFIDTLTTLARSDGYNLGDVAYVLSDTSEAVLDHARDELGAERRGITLEYVHANAASPTEALEPFSGRILRVHVTNVFDNLPGDKLAQINNKHFLIETRLYLPEEAVIPLSETYGLDASRLRIDLASIPQTGVERFLLDYRTCFHECHGETKGNLEFYRFWQDLYGNPDVRDTGLKLEERYVEIEPSRFDFIRPDLLPSGIRPPDILRDVLKEYPHNVWLHLSNRGLESGLLLLNLLHPRGALEIVDIIVRRIQDYHDVPQRMTSRGKRIYRMGFKGPAKYDGSAVDWFNGRLLEAFARAAYPDCTVSYEQLDAFGKPQMTLMEIRRS